MPGDDNDAIPVFGWDGGQGIKKARAMHRGGLESNPVGMEETGAWYAWHSSKKSRRSAHVDVGLPLHLPVDQHLDQRRHAPTALAAMLIDSPSMAALKKKDSTDCASTALRIDRDSTDMSDVWAATAMVKEKYRKSQ